MPVADHELAIAAALAGGAIVRARYGGALGRVDKSGGDFATEADIEAERAIVAVLTAARPDDAVLGEENGRAGPAGADRTWLVDPLCGTLNFVARTPLVAVNVALRSGSAVTAAAVADPFAGEVFWTDGRGAGVRRDGTDERLVPSAGSGLVDVNLDPPFPNDPAFRAVRMLADTRFAERFRPRVSSTSLAVAWVAAGRRAGYVTDGHGPPDDVHFAAGLALCEAAGCVVTDLRGRSPAAGAGLVVAADEATHASLLEMAAAP